MDMELKQKIAYMTQYDKGGMDDEPIIDNIYNNLSVTMSDEQIGEFMSWCGDQNDGVNQAIYDHMDQIGVSNYNEIMDFVKDPSGQTVFEEWKEDRRIFEISTLEEMADQELKERGIDANCLFWVPELWKIDKGAKYAAFNGYENGFDDTWDDDETLIATFLQEEPERIGDFIDENKQQIQQKPQSGMQRK